MPSAAADPEFVACRGGAGGAMYWDSYVARTMLGPAVSYAFPHVPHLWERRVLYAVEAALGEHLRACRRNKLRDPRVDVNIHVQYEAWRVAHQNDPGEPAVFGVNGVRAAAALRMAPRASLWLFNIILPSRTVKYYDELHGIMADPRRRPVFVTLDDHLVAVRADVLAFNRERVAAFYETHWPASIGAPWEVAAAVPHPVVDPERFVASPPPIPSPSATPTKRAPLPRFAMAFKRDGRF